MKYLLRQCPIKGHAAWVYERVENEAQAHVHAMSIMNFFVRKRTYPTMDDAMHLIDAHANHVESVSATRQEGRIKIPLLCEWRWPWTVCSPRTRATSRDLPWTECCKWRGTRPWARSSSATKPEIGRAVVFHSGKYPLYPTMAARCRLAIWTRNTRMSNSLSWRGALRLRRRSPNPARNPSERSMGERGLLHH